jgi:hypothetical protein
MAFHGEVSSFLRIMRYPVSKWILEGMESGLRHYEIGMIF